MKIFVTDDDVVARMIALDELQKTDYQLRELESGEDLLMAVEEESPDLILLDIEMPGMDGIKACRALRAGGHEVPVIFVSGHDDLDSRMKAYEAGGTDFIVKPYPPKELVRKVELTWEAINRDRERVSQTQYASQAAFTAMSELGETGVVINFLRASFACENSAQVAEKLFAAMAQYGLQGLVEIRHATTERYSSRGECSPLEVGILGHAGGMERIFRFRDRMAINFSNITLLALGMPVDDANRMGRLADHLAILAEGANEKILALDVEAQRRATAEGILRMVDGITDAMEQIDQHHSHNRMIATEVNQRYLTELTRAFVRLGLSEEQEAELTRLSQAAHEELETLMDADRAISGHLRTLENDLKQLVHGTSA